MTSARKSASTLAAPSTERPTYGVGGSTDQKLDAQKAAYKSIVAVCLAEPRCEAVTFCGVSDAHTWISGDTPLLFDAPYAAKPAYAGVLDALRGR